MNLIRPIASAFLASLVLISSIGVTVNLHLCCGQVQSFALYIKAEPCQDMQKTCHGIRNEKRQGCCAEETLVIKGKDTSAEIKTSVNNAPSYYLIAVLLPALYSVFESNAFVITPRFTYYKPPLPERDISIFVQSFLL